MPQAPAPAVLGLDPGSRCTGYAVVASGAGGRINLHRAGAITAPRGAPVPQRLGYIFSELARIIAELEPAEMAVEGIFTAKNARTALVLGQARGVAILAGVRAGMSIHEYPPATVKKSLVGNGRATKEQVRIMALRLVGSSQSKMPLDASDALALALTHLQSRRLAATLERLK
ncbi:MAG: crossover junction endodeoxyribonuclease RuvC [Desulfarculaceae bacterium]|nr:crossover junction endodeoxyribonuclease RuvC [Desulfarculaceae bacterium]MCF8048334.1 crossover junction endodeoxyribonuclease RuvC [Desulfarculaceae bacterium]MCF8064836.1 crossover junction endodeoxyribonuclease RuvC [Desulfarculaceae bacterium]MCF8099668.1 crossover junction endodeoxyribonuclease RuvC [Desulfarculaceae bacterium]MCF8123497.1 crossover junction endodeoxyribonuclease RuvC [Desulfarculaceae bacterium]